MQVWAGQAGPWEWRGRPRLAHSATYCPAAWLLAKPAARNSDHSLGHKCLHDNAHSASDACPRPGTSWRERAASSQSHPRGPHRPGHHPPGERARPEGLRAAAGPARALAEVGWGGQLISHMPSGSTLGAAGCGPPSERGLRVAAGGSWGCTLPLGLREKSEQRHGRKQAGALGARTESARLGPENSLRSTLNAKEPHLHCPGGLLEPLHSPRVPCGRVTIGSLSVNPKCSRTPQPAWMPRQAICLR